MIPRRAAYIAFPQAVPKKAVIDRGGSSPCSFACPAGIQAHGYVSLIRSGEYEKAFQLVLEATPLAGTLGRACYAPCETECTRGELEGTLPIRRLKRFADDWHHEHFDGPGVTVAPPNGKRVAIVGSGPAGLTAAWQLARGGYGVKIFEAAPEPGGFLRLAIPAYRLPAEVVAKDIKNVTDIGVEIVTSSPVRDLAALRRDGFDAVLVATGTPRSTSLGVPGEDRAGRPRRRRVPARRPARTRRPTSTAGASSSSAAATSRWTPRGPPGAWAPPASRSPTGAAARRCRPTGPRSTTRSARACSSPSSSPRSRWSRDATGAVRGLRCTKMALGAPDASGRRRPEPIPGSEFTIDCDVVIAAIGMAPDTRAFAGVVATDRNGTLRRRPGPRSRRASPASSPPATSSPAPRTSPAPSARAAGPRS